MTVFHRGVAGETQACFFARAFADQFSLAVSGGLVRVVAAFLSLEVRPGIAGTGAFGFVFGPETFYRRPRLNERPVHAEVFVGDPIVMPGQLNHGGEEQVRDSCWSSRL